LSPKPEGTAKPHQEAADVPKSFEAAFTELQRVVDQLEGGGLDLEHAVRLFDRGTTLAQICERIVDEAELRVTRLTAEPASALSDASPQEI
jgi:exodeoxyribonuclease VII small subunit